MSFPFKKVIPLNVGNP
jgi:aspartate/methionine/tyrosine aminotransferase